MISGEIESIYNREMDDYDHDDFLGLFKKRTPAEKATRRAARTAKRKQRREDKQNRRLQNEKNRVARRTIRYSDPTRNVRRQELQDSISRALQSVTSIPLVSNALGTPTYEAQIGNPNDPNVYAQHNPLVAKAPKEKNKDYTPYLIYGAIGVVGILGVALIFKSKK